MHRRDIINEIPDHDIYLMLGISMRYISVRLLFELNKRGCFKYIAYDMPRWKIVSLLVYVLSIEDNSS